MRRTKKRLTNKKEQISFEKKYLFSRDFYGIVLLIIGVFCSYFILFPENSGIIGQFLFNKVMSFFGQLLYLLPIIIFWYSWELFYKERFNIFKKIFGFILFFFGSTSFVSVLSVSLNILNNGGWLGTELSFLIFRLFGTAGVYVLSASSFSFGFFLVTELSFISLIKNIRYLILRFIEFIKSSIENLYDSIKNSINKLQVKPKKEHKEEKIDREEPSIINQTEPKINLGHDVKEEKKGGLLKRKEIIESKPKTNVLVLDEEKTHNGFKDYIIPSTDLLAKHKNLPSKNIRELDLKENAKLLESTLLSFGVEARVEEINTGPVVTSYELMPSPGTKVSSITNLSDDIALALKAPRVRIIAPIPGKAAIGIEIPNAKRQPVLMKDIVDTDVFENSGSPLSIVVGKDVRGFPVVTNIESMPHLLVAGSTGSGKSVFVNNLIMSVLYKAKPNEVKFILIDPKRVELSMYKDMPHLYAPVITNPKDASKILNELVQLMETRYKKFAEVTVRNIESYNNKMEKLGKEKEFYMLVIIDELADLMMVASRDVESAIVRLSQMARAVGIHLVLATQRPSVDVITGVIKTNLPSRISFQVLSRTDSRVILDSIGAEALVGKGDMLFLSAGDPKPKRVQGCYVSEEEVARVLSFIKNQAAPDYSFYKNDIVSKNTINNTDKEQMELLKKALSLVVERKKVSYDLLRANGFSGPKASNLISLMEVKGFIEKPTGTNRWSIDFDVIEEFLS